MKRDHRSLWTVTSPVKYPILFDSFLSNNYPTNLLEIESRRIFSTCSFFHVRSNIRQLPERNKFHPEMKQRKVWFVILERKGKKEREISKRPRNSHSMFSSWHLVEHQSCYTACKNQGMHTKSCRKVGCYFVADVLALMKFMNSLPRGLVTRGGTFI